MRKQTMEEKKAKIAIISPNIEILSDSYEGCKSKIPCRCNVCGYEWGVIWNSLQRGSGCPKCGGCLKLTMPEVREKLSILSPTIEIMSEIYENSHAKLDLRCVVCGHEWKAAWTDLSQGKGCPSCSNVMRQTLEQAKERLARISPTLTITSKTYTNAREKIDIHCDVCNHNYQSTWDNLLHGKGCPNCSGRIVNYEDVVSRLAILNPNITILDTEYVSSKAKMRVKCDICGHEWITKWNNLSQGSGCMKCSIERRTGSTSPTWKGGIAPIKEYLRGVILQWKKDSARGCKYKCVISGENFDHIHHIHNFSEIVYETFDICGISRKQKVVDYTEQELLQLSIVCIYLHDEYGLGKCLTKELHIEFHSTYGNRNNTLEQFEEFVELKRKERELINGSL